MSEENKQLIDNKQYCKEYYKTKKEEKIKCDRCGKEGITKFSLGSHYKSKFCQTVFCVSDTNAYLKIKELKDKKIEAQKIKDEIKDLQRKLDTLYSV